MKISDIEKKINASYNTIKRFIEQNDEYNEKINNVLHATEKGLHELEKEYGVKSDILSEDNISFYKSQIYLLNRQLDESRNFNQVFLNRIENNNHESIEKEKYIKSLEKELHLKEIQKMELKFKLETERNKTLWQKIFSKKGSRE